MNAKPDPRSILPRDLFAGTTVFVTGGGSGINLGIARTFAGLGADAGICGRSQERLDAAAAAAPHGRHTGDRRSRSVSCFTAGSVHYGHVAWVDGGQALSGSGFFNSNCAAFRANAPAT